MTPSSRLSLRINFLVIGEMNPLGNLLQQYACSQFLPNKSFDPEDVHLQFYRLLGYGKDAQGYDYQPWLVAALNHSHALQNDTAPDIGYFAHRIRPNTILYRILPKTQNITPDARLLYTIQAPARTTLAHGAIFGNRQKIR